MATSNNPAIVAPEPHSLPRHKRTADTDHRLAHHGTFTVVPWHDPVVDGTGFAVDHPYVEMFWLPVLGPTATWLLRRLAGGLAVQQEGFEVDGGDLARALGVSHAGGRSSPFGRAMQRCTMFGVAHYVSLEPAVVYAVRRRVPAIARRHLDRLPESLTGVHEQWINARV